MAPARKLRETGEEAFKPKTERLGGHPSSMTLNPISTPRFLMLCR